MVEKSASRIARIAWLACALALLAGGAGSLRAQQSPQSSAPFHLIEATIDGIHAELRSGRLSCVELVQAYLNRIDAYDQKGPTLNAIQNINPDALKTAAELDARYKASGELTGPLHCIPVLVKDEVNTNFMPTTYGSAVFKTFVPQKNATIVERLQAAGAIILAKTNMGEFAQGYSGSAFGDCHNAYDPRRSPSGSSCGTGVGIAANFAAVGIGEDTGGSIRGPASHGSLVGLRPTLPLVSRAGMMPFSPTRDTLGPITRTVRDTAIMLDVIAGYDPADPVTAWSYGQKPKSYTSFLIANGLAGMRFGVIRAPMGRDTDPSSADYKEIQAAVTRAAKLLIARGAELIDPIAIPSLKEMIAAASGGEGAEAEAAIDAFLAQQPNAPVRSLREIVASPVINAKRREELTKALGHTVKDAGYFKEVNAREELRIQILHVMAENRLDALIYATYDHAPTPVPVSTPGSNRMLAASLAFPAIALPAGFFADGLPIGIELLGRPYAEGLLLRAAFDYEQAAKNRRSPPLTPALPKEP
jgi:Asp-tRNA(Asn)/Glu-tRNA(Gln) amidotransferase A subunit family amidase